MIFVNVKTLFALMLFLEQVRGATYLFLAGDLCQRAPRWWLLP